MFFTQAAQATAAAAAAQNSQGGARAGAPAASTRRVVKGLKAPKSLAAKAMYKTEQKGPTKQNIFDDVKGEKGAFVMMPDGDVMNVGHELEMKERLIENMMFLYSALLTKGLLKKLRAKKGLYRRVALIAAAVLSHLYGDSLQMDIRLAARLFGAQLADLLGDNEEFETYIDPLTGEVKTRRKRKPLPKLEVIVDADGRMWVITDSGEKMELFKDPKTGKWMFRTQSGTLIPVPENLDLITDPITGKLYLAEKRDPGVEIFVDPLTGKMYIRTKDGQKLEIMRDEKTGKLFMRTASGNWVELPDDLQVYTDPVTGKIFLGQPPPPPPPMEIYTDPLTGKQYLRTADGELLELVMGEDGKYYVRTESGNLRALPDDMQMFTDPVTGKTYMGANPAAGYAIGGGDAFEMFTDPVTGKTYIRTRDGQIMEVYVDPETGKTYFRTKSGRLKELPADMELYVDPITGKSYIRQTKDPGLEIFTDPVTGKMYMRTKDGEVLEVIVGEDGKTYFRTKSGNLKEIGDHLEMYVDPITGKMYLGERRNPGMEMWTDPDTGITYVRTADGQVLEMWTDPDTGKTYLRTKSGRIVSEVDENMMMYTDPKTGKRYLASKPGAQKAGVFTDPITGKIYLRTASGRIIEATLDGQCELWVNALLNKILLKEPAGRMNRVPANFQLIYDSKSLRVLLQLENAHLIELTNSREVGLNTSTNKLNAKIKGAGDADFSFDLDTSDVFLSSGAKGRSTAIASDGSVYYEAKTSTSYVRTISGRFHELPTESDASLNTEKTQVMVQAMDGLKELGEDVLLYTEPTNGKTFFRTTSGHYTKLEDDLEVIWKKETGFGKIHFKLGENENDVKEVCCNWELKKSSSGKDIVVPDKSVCIGWELFTDATGRKYLRARDDAFDDIDLSKLPPEERARIEALRRRKMKADEKRRREEDVLKRQEERQHQEMMKTLGMDEFIKEKQRLALQAEREKSAEMKKKTAEQLWEERELIRRAEMLEKMKNMATAEQVAYEEMMNEYDNWNPLMLQELNFMEQNSALSQAFLYSYFEVLKMSKKAPSDD
ncbi:uncharacterized protein LOC134856841 [Symsagittifera roscoffensis]|uniref:uncharacterized protein LOC134856841 n=1 Tax=Symsagittifera roscoffensis TaxID=84072 RepID=UPI00307C06CB